MGGGEGGGRPKRRTVHVFFLRFCLLCFLFRFLFFLSFFLSSFLSFSVFFFFFNFFFCVSDKTPSNQKDTTSL